LTFAKRLPFEFAETSNTCAALPNGVHEVSTHLLEIS
jgi:hypothetical protein